MTINWLQQRAARACVNRSTRDKSRSVTPCVASAMAYLHHALTQSGNQALPLRQVETVGHLGALAAALAARRPATVSKAQAAGGPMGGSDETSEERVHSRARGTRD